MNSISVATAVANAIAFSHEVLCLQYLTTIRNGVRQIRMESALKTGHRSRRVCAYAS